MSKNLFIFLAGLFIIIFLSRFSLKKPESYKIYRSLVWEFILILFILNRQTWFQDPLSWHQWISWILLIISLLPLITGIYYLRKFGVPTDSIETTTKLVDKGIYKYIRHPLYSSLLFLSWGIFFKSPTINELLLTLLILLFIFATAREDEKTSSNKFGVSYISYSKKTKRFIPYLF